MQGVEKNFSSGQPKGYPTLKRCFAAPHMYDMSARNFFRNAVVGMKYGFLEVSISHACENIVAETLAGYPQYLQETSLL